MSKRVPPVPAFPLVILDDRHTRDIVAPSRAGSDRLEREKKRIMNYDMWKEEKQKQTPR